MNAIQKNMNDAAYAQLIALRKSNTSASECVELTTDSLMEEFGCSRRRAMLKVTAAWYDLEAAGAQSAYIDVSHTTGNSVVIHDTATGRTSIFSVRELLQLRDQAVNPIAINA
jgi:hypothetical protein